MGDDPLIKPDDELQTEVTVSGMIRNNSSWLQSEFLFSKPIRSPSETCHPKSTLCYSNKISQHIKNMPKEKLHTKQSTFTFATRACALSCCCPGTRSGSGTPCCVARRWSVPGGGRAGGSRARG